MTSMMTQDQKEKKRKRGGKAQEIVNVSRAIGKFFFLFFKKKNQFKYDHRNKNYN